MLHISSKNNIQPQLQIQINHISYLKLPKNFTKNLDIVQKPSNTEQTPGNLIELVP